MNPRNRFQTYAAVTALALFAAGILERIVHYWPRQIPLRVPGVAEAVSVSTSGTRLYIPQLLLIGELAQFDDALFAFLMFDYYRGQPLLSGRTLMLVSEEGGDKPTYRVLVQLPPDFIEGLNILGQLMAQRLASNLQFHWVTPQIVAARRKETAVFVAAYNGPATRCLRTLHASELQGYVRRFIRFKSQTDPRIARAIDPVPSPLTRNAASRLAADIIAVARFYSIPLDLFLGIGAMENNYMNVAGDLENTRWKPRAEPGDVVIRRRHGRVLVQNDSRGVWQITRESLRYAYQLYGRDQRDYRALPERLRPPANFDINAVDNDVLTTYSGLLLRDLLDRFHGDVSLAAGAYNGGPDNPNAHYAAGVQMVADYARRIIGRAAEIDRLTSNQDSVSLEKLRTAPQ